MYWTLLIGGTAVAIPTVLYFMWASQRWSKLDFLGASDTYLCDSCKYNDARYCSQPDRPNAKRCPDYKIAG